MGRKVDKLLRHKAKVMSLLLARPDRYEVFFPSDMEDRQVAIAKKIAASSFKDKFLTVDQLLILEAAYLFNEEERRIRGLSSMGSLWADYVAYKRSMVRVEVA